MIRMKQRYRQVERIHIGRSRSYMMRKKSLRTLNNQSIGSSWRRQLAAGERAVVNDGSMANRLRLRCGIDT